MTEIETLLNEICTYCERVHLKPKTFSRRAVADSKFVDRLRAGGQCLPSTMARVRKYMADNPPPKPELGAATQKKNAA